MRSSIYGRIVTIWVLVIISLPVNSLELGYELGAQFHSSENIFLVSKESVVMPQEEITHTSYIKLNAVENSQFLQAQFNSDFSYQTYQFETSSDSYVGSLFSELLWDISSGMYSWYLFEKYSQIAIKTNEPLTNSNQQNINEFVSGPNLKWQIGRVDWIEFEARLHSFYFENSNTNNERVSGVIRWAKSLSQSMRLSLTYNSIKTDFQDEGNNNNFTQSNVYVGISYQRNLNNFELNLGKASLNEENLPVSNSNYVNIILRRQMTGGSSVNLEYRQDISDASNEIESGLSALVGVFKQKSSSIEYVKEASTVSWGFQFISTKRDNDISTDNEIEDSVIFNISKIVGVRSNLSLALESKSKEVNSLIQGGYTDTEYRTALNYNYRINRNLFTMFASESLMRLSTESFREYEDTRIHVTFSYRG